MATRTIGRYRVAIVGGGVAGCATALTLAQRGISNLCIVDAGRSESVRVGESIPPDTCTLLNALGLWDAFLHQDHEECLGSCSSWGSADLGYNDFVLNPYGRGWHLDRERFESLLAGEVVKNGTRWLAGKMMLGCDRSGDRGFNLHLLSKDGQHQTVIAEAVVDATGSGSSLARHLGSRHLFLDHLVFVCGFFQTQHERGGRSGPTLLEAAEHGWWYLAPVPRGRVVTAFATDAETMLSGAWNHRERWLSALLRTDFIAKQLNEFPFVFEKLIVRPAPSFLLDRSAGPGWFAVGDAASAYDPLSSQGIYKALSDGLRAGTAISESFLSAQDQSFQYDSLVRQQFKTYTENRNFFYGLERRWRKSPFWRRRQERTELDISSKPLASIPARLFKQELLSSS